MLTKYQNSKHGIPDLRAATVLTRWFDQTCRNLSSDRAIAQQVFNQLITWRNTGKKYLAIPLDGSPEIFAVTRPQNVQVLAAVETVAAGDALMQKLKAGYKIIDK